MLSCHTAAGQNPESTKAAAALECGEKEMGGRRCKLQPYTRREVGAVYIYEFVRVHVGMCAVGARARAFDFREEADEGSVVIATHSIRSSRKIEVWL